MPHSLNSGVGTKCFFHFHWKKLGMHLRTFFVDILTHYKKFEIVSQAAFKVHMTPNFPKKFMGYFDSLMIARYKNLILNGFIA